MPVLTGTVQVQIRESRLSAGRGRDHCREIPDEEEAPRCGNWLWIEAQIVSASRGMEG